MQIHEQVVDAAVDIKRAESHGQFDLFGGLEAEGDESLVPRGDIPIGEWDKTVLLAHEREMLGLYVSDHPLHGAERMLAQLTDRTIAAILLDDSKESSIVTVGGLVTSVQRKTTKKGSPWAIVTLEDLEGSVEVMVFPQAYASVSTLLVDDSVIIVKARVDHNDDDGLRLMAMEVTAAGPDRGGQRAGTPDDGGLPLHPAAGREAQGGPVRPSGHHRGPPAPHGRRQDHGAPTRRPTARHAVAGAVRGPEGAARTELPGMSPASEILG